MKTGIPAFMLVASAMFGGCTIQQICPPVQGTVVDANTSEPVPNAQVQIEYFDSNRITHTDAQGRFAFNAKHKVFPPVNVHLKRISGFVLHIEADGYAPGRTTRQDYVRSIHIRSDGPPHDHKMQRSDSGAIVVAPIELASSPADQPK